MVVNVWLLGIPVIAVVFYIFTSHVNGWEFDKDKDDGVVEYITVALLSCFWPIVFLVFLPIVAISLYKTIGKAVKARTDTGADAAADANAEGR